MSLLSCRIHRPTRRQAFRPCASSCRPSHGALAPTRLVHLALVPNDLHVRLPALRTLQDIAGTCAQHVVNGGDVGDDVVECLKTRSLLLLSRKRGPHSSTRDADDGTRRRDADMYSGIDAK
jgi:hypothetical protein